MHGPEKSDAVVVAGKPTNKAVRSVAEPVEPRTGTKGNADQQSTRRAQDRVSVSQALERVRQAARHAPSAGSGKRVTGTGTRTASSKAKEEGEVHSAPAPCRPRHAENGVLRAQA